MTSFQDVVKLRIALNNSEIARLQENNKVHEFALLLQEKEKIIDALKLLINNRS